MNRSFSTTDAQALTYVVAGMTCGHGKVAVTDEVSTVAGVSAVDVDLDTPPRAWLAGVGGDAGVDVHSRPWRHRAAVGPGWSRTWAR